MTHNLRGVKLIDRRQRTEPKESDGVRSRVYPARGASEHIINPKKKRKFRIDLIKYFKDVKFEERMWLYLQKHYDVQKMDG